MKNVLAVVAIGILLAVGVYYSVQNARHPVVDPALVSIVKAAPVVKSICVEPIQNRSNKPLAMDGVDDEFVAKLRGSGFTARKISDAGGQCDANTNAEIVAVSGRGRKTARFDFRLTLTGEQVPRMSSSVEGKSGGKGDALDESMSEFAVSLDPKEQSSAEREAIVAALEKGATQIDAANKRGMPQWQDK